MSTNPSQTAQLTFQNFHATGGESAKTFDPSGEHIQLSELALALPVVGAWAAHPRLNKGFRPYRALGCGDAWCVTDGKGTLAWENTQAEGKVFDDEQVARQVADEWNRS